MAKKKVIKKSPKSKELKDFEIVAHTIKVEPVELHGENYKWYKVHAIYINRYGLEVGYLVYNENSQQYYSWDYSVFMEYIESKTADEQI